MKTSGLIKLLQEQLEKDGDAEVVIEVEELEFFPEVYDVTGRWSTFDTSRHGGTLRCFIHGQIV